MLNILYQFVSSIILTCFLSVLFFLSLWHNFVTVHFQSKPDPRDIRSSRTNINPHKKPSPNKIRRYSRASTSSTSPLDLENDDENNIEYDHTITSLRANLPMEYFKSTNKTQNNPVNVQEENEQSHIYDNPFKTDTLSLEDHKLVPDLKYYYHQYNIEIEEFRVTTDDGFVLDLWHLVPLGGSAKDQLGKYPLLLLHGLLQSAGAFASSGKSSLAYYLYEQGFDIWLGNNRCGFNPDWDMQKLNNDKKKKWDWDIHEMCQYDLKCLIEFVLEKTIHFEKLTLVAHSQGTTQSLLGLVNGEKLYSSNFKLIDKVDNFVALAPAIYPGPLLNEKVFVRFMGMGIDSPWVFGTKSFIPLMMFMRNIGAGTKLFSFFSYIMFNYMFDWNDVLWDKRLRDRNFLFSPVNISVKLMQWWLSSDVNKTSFKYGSNKMFPHDKTWFPLRHEMNETRQAQHNIHLNPPRDTAKDFPQIMLFIPKQDRLVDGERLINHFVNYEDNSVYKIWYIDEYSHLDVLWAYDVIERIGKPIINNIRYPNNPLDDTNTIITAAT
ncbi:similar to Saccharomyces cerevisiae YLR020C YEH2 Steryl ester hydrolase, catalyzes steryl ester hydrolysis at the plasma membrane [Maudiozyma barnettii]|uniref:sterol esterase n=1 Tax=Maudiozyma barnettii TaxID=61262 RepID=A0A8H2VC44_9SACH|nr:sterol esterase [Kazachstania barnettii]CAB4252524.1 similar to Saccharomyces cerevisiae YLR020C YEH2 Steryl ester hydrolase, catalyzes steryl ester hydrolysis at the plasma membrane [Kazachstania barnettii]CAD1779258.1 similar to Saccharomyces cerevisiae YLR020C YEH2 Steryl ester hydrolase, catalyzes steryl ester hydrolysis at the plasma membrane [Kazachstania barnettii]